MAYKRKTKDVWVIQTNYGYGWEDECTEETLSEAVVTYEEYLENLTGRAVMRLRKKRVRREDVK